jgi:hypothetical protein
MYASGSDLLLKVNLEIKGLTCIAPDLVNHNHSQADFTATVTFPIIVHGKRPICKAKGARRNLRQLQSRNLATTISEQKVFLDEAVFAKKNLISFLARIKAKYLFSVMF